MATLNTGQAQVQNNVFGQYRLTPGSPTPQSFAIGNNYTLGYALDVHGEQMNPPLGDVFKTDGPDDKDTYWRMFRGGKEYGNIFNLTAKNDWNLNATTGYMKFHTNSLERMRLSPTLTGQTINGYTGLDLSGFLCIGQYSGASNSVQQAYTLLHLNEFGINPGGYRPWMRVGMLATRGSDMSYFGLRTDPQGATNNTVVAWCDNPLGEIGADALQFVFSAHPTGGTGIAGTLSGLEAGRFISAVGGDEAYFGLGDYYTAGINPTQRLDLLNGKVRIRKLPDDPAATEPYKIMVVDDSPGNSINRGIVKWIDPTSLVSGCEWELNPGTQNNVSTAYSNVLSTSCPDVTDAVGIGVDLGSSAAIAKLKVKNTSSVATMTDGIQVAVSKAGVANGMLINASSSSKPVTGINVTVNGSGTGADGVAIGARLVVTGSMGGASTRGAQVITNGTCTVARAGSSFRTTLPPRWEGLPWA
ncbi:MAG: hypothetical protein IPL86_05750 [Flavobacteriales bacterium]|nr:hypothetical protein [Flavobacteriales bacterium]